MRKLIAPTALALLAALSSAASATTVALSTNKNSADYGQWNEFSVDASSAVSGGKNWIDFSDSSSPDFGSALSFTFSIHAGERGMLTIVDSVFAGDTFSIYNNGQLLGTTSSVAQTSWDTADYEYDFDADLANANFSKAVFELGEGNYTITGSLLQSVLDSDQVSPLNATRGGIKLNVPEPSSLALLLAGMGLMGALSRRRRG